ncbi:YopX family protein [Paramuribaculum intestinale]|jgi:phage uncharacterized protein TIGR01671|uniref:YopX family protein n=1 Tax=Paramuribaculum intestinale TaxID=2094151 RepID=UPI00272B4DF9|nr:YopX family protein [Paramuribaculum intestinale]
MGIRKIIFRGKRLDNGEWAYGSLAETHGKLFIGIPTDPDNPVFMMDWHIVDPATVGQFTGLLDKNGKEIYEGDIVVYGGHCKHVVEFKHGMFGYAVMGGWFIGYGGNSNFTFNPLDKSDEHEIIGNIHDNKLLNEK